MRRALLVALALCAGCNKDDLCGGMLGADVVCYTVHVGGDADEGDIDQLQVDVKYDELMGTSSSKTITRRTLIGVDRTETDAGSARLPLSFPLVFQLPGQATDLSRAIVTALSSGKAVGIGFAKLGVGTLNFDTPKPGTSHSVDANLTPASKADCFNPNILGSSLTDKSDRTCGGAKCQACTQGLHCSSSSDCVFPLTCNFSSDTCEP